MLSFSRGFIINDPPYPPPARILWHFHGSTQPFYDNDKIVLQHFCSTCPKIEQWLSANFIINDVLANLIMARGLLKIICMMLVVLAMMSLIAAKAPAIPPGPPIQEVHKVALEYARIDAGDASKWKKRVKVAAVLPRLQFDYVSRIRNYVNVDVNDNVYVGSDNVVVGPEEGTYKESADAQQSFGVKAVWALNELIFSRDSLNVSRETLNIVRERNALLDTVNKHYFERKKLIGEITELQEKKVPQALAAKKEHELLIRRLAAEKENAALDALTGGWFIAQLNN